MSEKGNPIISQHDVESSGCSVNNECNNSGVNSFKEPPMLSERRYTTSINDKTILTSVITSTHGDCNVTDLNSISTVISSANTKSGLEQDSILSNQMSISLSLPMPLINRIINSKSNTSEVELPIPSVSTPVVLPSVPTGDIAIGSEFPNVEEWLKARSDSLSSLDFDTEIKSTEIDETDFLNLKSSVSQNTSVNSSIDHNTKLSQDIVGMYNNETAPSSSGLMLNSFCFESDGSLSSVSTNGCDIPRNKNNNNVNYLRKNDLVQVERGLFEEMLLTESNKKNFKIKDSIMGDDKGLFEELLMPGVQEWLLTVSSSDKKDSASTTPVDSISVPQSPNGVSVLPINDQDDASNKDTFDEYDLIGRNINTLKLMTPQEIENMPSRSLGFDDGQLKAEEIGGEGITDLPFESCEDKDLPDLPSGSNNDVDHKLFNILAMDASNDTLDNNNFSENILDSINQESGKSVESTPSENFIFSVDSKNLNSELLLKNNLTINKTQTKINNFPNISTLNEKLDSGLVTDNLLKSKEPLEKTKPVNYILSDSSSAKPSLSNVKIITKYSSSNPNSPSNKPLNQKNKSLPVGVVQLKLSSSVSSSKQQGSVTCVAEKKSATGTLTSLPQILIKPATIQTQGSISVPGSQTECNILNSHSLSHTVKQSAGNILPIQNVAGIAKVNISVDCKANTTNVSIISSNKEHTVFKINTSDLMRAVSSIKEFYLEPLGLKNQQLIETANAAHKLLSIHSHISYLKKNNQDGDTKTPQNFEINQYIQEVKIPVSRSRTTLSNVGHILTATKISEANPKTHSFSKLDTTNATNTIQTKKVEEKPQVKKLITEKPRGHGENVGISLLPGAPPTMVSVPSVLDALSGPTTSKVNIAQVLAGCELTATDGKSEAKEGQQDNNSVSDEKTNNALVQLGINPHTLSPSVGPKGNKRWQCPIASCTKQFPKLSYLKVHILNHKGIRPYKCSYENCDWSFYTSYKLKRHLETHLKRRDFVCTEPDCSRRFTTIYNLNTHMTLHKRPKTWICSLVSCGKAFHTRRELEAHMKLHTDVKPPYKCSVEGCSKAYFTPNSLASHMRSHHKEEDLRCQWAGCGKRFDKPCRLKAHMRVHTGQRPYVCNFEGCNWRFQCASKLSRHQRKHTNDRKYSCPICKKAFLRSEHLKGHLLTHTGVRNFQCPITNCEAKFTAKSSLYVHLKKHKTQKSDVKFHCPIEACDKIYDSKFNLRQHLLKNHTPILTSDSNHLDYITLVSDKELNDQLLPQSLPTFDVNKPNFSTFSSFSLQSASVEAPSTALEVNSASEKESSSLSHGSGDGNLVVPLLAMSSASTLSSENQTEAGILTVTEGLFPFAEGDSSHTSTELGFPDLPLKETSSKGSFKGLVFQGGSAARTDVLGNIILSQRAKRRQQLSMARKLAASNELSKPSFCNDLILSTSVGDALPLSSHFQTSIMQDDGMSGALYEDALISRDLISDPTSDPQSTINLRDLE